MASTTTHTIAATGFGDARSSAAVGAGRKKTISRGTEGELSLFEWRAGLVLSEGRARQPGGQGSGWRRIVRGRALGREARFGFSRGRAGVVWFESG